MKSPIYSVCLIGTRGIFEIKTMLGQCISPENESGFYTLYIDSERKYVWFVGSKKEGIVLINYYNVLSTALPRWQTFGSRTHIYLPYLKQPVPSLPCYFFHLHFPDLPLVQ